MNTVAHHPQDDPGYPVGGCDISVTGAEIRRSRPIDLLTLLGS